jgi:hypothetical protein
MNLVCAKNTYILRVKCNAVFHNRIKRFYEKVVCFITSAMDKMVLD